MYINKIEKKNVYQYTSSVIINKNLSDKNHQKLLEENIFCSNPIYFIQSKSIIVKKKIYFYYRKNYIYFDTSKFKFNKKDIQILGANNCIDKGFFFSSNGEHMYHHFFYNVLTKLYYKKKKFNKYKLLMFSNTYDKFKNILIDLNISNILILDENKKYFIKDLVVIKNVCNTKTFSKNSFDYLYNLISRQLKTYNKNQINYKKVFISRDDVKNDKRSIINKNELHTLLYLNGFQKLELSNYNITSQKEIFENAQIIVSEHGSSGANFFFSNPKTTIIILQPNSTAFNIHSRISIFNNIKVNYFLTYAFKLINDNHNHYSYINLEKFASFLNEMQTNHYDN